MSPLFAPPAMHLEPLADGSLRIRPRQALGPYPRAVGVWLEQWAREAPDRTFLAQRAGEGWARLTYGDAMARVRRLGAALLRNAAKHPGPVAVLSHNSLDHACLLLAAMHVGIPVASISNAYSLASQDHQKLARLIRELSPGLVFAEDGAAYGAALAAIAGEHGARVVCSHHVPAHAERFDALMEADDPDAVDAAFASVGPDTVAKILYTSGSTGDPKGVINTQRMLCSNQQAKAQIWPFLAQVPPVILDWLPWSHTFGANHNFHLVLRNGGTLYIDQGRPMPGAFDASLANLLDVAPTLYFNVPRGYDLLVSALRERKDLREHFFSRLQLLFYAAAALPQHLWQALSELSTQARGTALPMVSAWGTTETAPLATDCHFQATRSGNIGVPVPGCELKLLPAGEDAFEIRVRGPNITPGYFKRPQQTAQAFDDEGYYLTGDAVRFAREGDADAGLLFGGRLSEDFKLSTGTWVNVGILRVRAIEALAPVAQDIVIAGHDRDHLGFLVFPNLEACRALSGQGADTGGADVLASAPVRQALRAGLLELKAQGGGSSMHAPRALLLQEPPDIDAGEITDKGYLNQRAVLQRRAQQVEALFAVEPGAELVRI